MLEEAEPICSTPKANLNYMTFTQTMRDLKNDEESKHNPDSEDTPMNSESSNSADEMKDSEGPESDHHSDQSGNENKPSSQNDSPKLPQSKRKDVMNKTILRVIKRFYCRIFKRMFPKLFKQRIVNVSFEKLHSAMNEM